MDFQDKNLIGTPDPLPADTSQDGTLNLQPAVAGSAEGTIFLKSPELQNVKIEKYTEQAPVPEAAVTSQEQAPIPEVPKAPEKQEDKIESIVPEPTIVPAPAPTQIITASTPTEEPKNVVDLRTNHEPLHNVPKIADKYTAKADEDENLFIKEVEKQHGHK